MSYASMVIADLREQNKRNVEIIAKIKKDVAKMHNDITRSDENDIVKIKENIESLHKYINHTLSRD